MTASYINQPNTSSKNVKVQYMTLSNKILSPFCFATNIFQSKNVSIYAWLLNRCLTFKRWKQNYLHCIILNSVDDSFDAQEVLIAMRDYIVAFFGCRECAQHFEKGAVSLEKEVDRYRQHFYFMPQMNRWEQTLTMEMFSLYLMNFLMPFLFHIWLSLSIVANIP